MLPQNLSEQPNVHILPSMCGFYSKTENDLCKGWEIFSLKIEIN